MTLEERQKDKEHCNGLQYILNSCAEDLGCKLKQHTPSMAGMMFVEFGYVEGPIMVSYRDHIYPNVEARFMTCMHELGHFALGHTQGRPLDKYFRYVNPGFDINKFSDRKKYFNNGVLRSEAEAWIWALDYCWLKPDDIPQATRQWMWKYCLGSYYRSAVNRGFGVPGQRLYNGDRNYVTFAWDQPDETFWNAVAKILNTDLPAGERNQKAVSELMKQTVPF